MLQQNKKQNVVDFMRKKLKIKFGILTGKFDHS